MRLHWLTSIVAMIIFQAQLAFSQPTDQTETIRVTVSMNADGSRTVYKFDDAQHKAVATTTGQDGKVREKIRYQLDDAGRYSSGMVFGADGRLRFKSHYKYDNAGRLPLLEAAREKRPTLGQWRCSLATAGKNV